MNSWFPQSWPALGIAVIVSTYWLRVMQMVARSRKAAGHGANFVPPEAIGRVVRILWIPVVMLWVLLPLAAAFGLMNGLPGLRPLFAISPLQWTALVVAAVAYGLTWVCWTVMGTSWRMGIDPAEKTRLVVSGPFAFVRHPIYGLSSVIMIATMLVVPSPLMITAGLVHLLLLQWEVRREDVYLVTTHGQPYADYQRRVGRFLPRSFRGYVP